MTFTKSLLKPDTGELSVRATFHEQMAASFSLDELHQIAFDLRVNWDALPGDTVNIKALSLYEFMERRGDLYRLAALCQQERPSLNWIVT